MSALVRRCCAVARGHRGRRDCRWHTRSRLPAFDGSGAIAMRVGSRGLVARQNAGGDELEVENYDTPLVVAFK